MSVAVGFAYFLCAVFVIDSSLEAVGIIIEEMEGST